MKKCAWCFVASLFCLGTAAKSDNVNDSIVLTHGSGENRNANENDGRKKLGKENGNFVRADGAVVNVVSNKNKEKIGDSVRIYGDRFDSAAERIAGVCSDGEIFRDLKIILNLFDLPGAGCIGKVSVIFRRGLKNI